MTRAFLEYFFMFDPVDTWQHLHQFEQDLAKFFLERGLEVEIVTSMAGQVGRRILLIKKKEMIKTSPSVQKGRPKSVGGKLRDMRTKKLRAPAKKWLNKRKFRKEKGFNRVMKKAGG